MPAADLPFPRQRAEQPDLIRALRERVELSPSDTKTGTIIFHPPPLTLHASSRSPLEDENTLDSFPAEGPSITSSRFLPAAMTIEVMGLSPRNAPSLINGGSEVGNLPRKT